MSLAYVVPSRGRPANIARLVDAWADTGATAHLEVCVDDDDPALGDYLALGLAGPARLRIGPRRRLGGTLNQVAPELAARHRAIGFMGDDHVPRSPGWDRRLLDAIEAGARVAYGNDLVHGPALPTAVALDATVIARLGYMVPPGLVHLFMDNYWAWLGEHLGALAYLDDVVIEHVHPIVGRAEWDEGYVEANATEVWEHDEARWHRWLAEEADAALALLR